MILFFARILYGRTPRYAIPWRPVIEKEIGREVVGIVRGTDIAWQFSDSTKSLTIAEFSWVMAFLEIGKTVDADRAARSKAKSKD